METPRIAWAAVAVMCFLSVATSAGARDEARLAVSFTRFDLVEERDSVFTINANGSGLTQTLKARQDASYWDPSWSRDGRRLAVQIENVPDEGNGDGDVWIVEPRRPPIMIPGGESPYSGSPSWAPDGQRIVLVGYQGQSGGGLYIAKVGSRRATALTPEDMGGGPLDDAPAWSPDGTTIAFARTDHGSALYVIRPDGSRLRKVVQGFNPSWSPDSKRIAFDDGRRLGIVDLASRRVVYTTRPPGRDADPAWSPDGRTIAFVRYPPGATRGDIWLMNANGTALRLLVRNGDAPTWKRN